MTQQILNIGAAPNDGTGDVLRDGGDKINQNFSELYLKDNDLDLNKVDKIVGKGLSEEDFTTILKSKIDNIPAGADGDMQFNVLGALQAVAGNKYNSANQELEIGTKLSTADIKTLALQDSFGFESEDLTGFTTDGDQNWIATNTTANSGSWSAQSGAIGHKEFTALHKQNVTATEHNFVQFYYQTSTELDFDFLEFYINEKLIDRFSGENPWTQSEKYYMPAGTHTYTWRYVKDTAVVGGSDKVEIDDITITEIKPSTTLKGLSFFKDVTVFENSPVFLKPIDYLEVKSDLIVGDKAFGSGGGNFEFNLVAGKNAAPNLTNGNARNVILGDNAAPLAVDAEFTTILGYGAAVNLTSGIKNTFVGNGSGVGIGSGSGNTIIGARYSNWAAGLTDHVILLDGNGTIVFQRNNLDEITLPQLTISKIDSGGAKSPITKEYGDANYTKDGATITPTQITANQNDYNPTGFDTIDTGYMIVDLDANREITGFDIKPNGFRFTVINKDTSLGDLKFKNQSVLSTVGGRIFIDADITIKPNQAASFIKNNAIDGGNGGYYCYSINNQ